VLLLLLLLLMMMMMMMLMMLADVCVQTEGGDIGVRDGDVKETQVGSAGGRETAGDT